ncbi:MAG TPA: prefoldin subunit alpha [Candidatus Thermoplasmatota archaeon]|nr:prefoldin subunit alpha [Candidatus Thermoplasmatota archaeon]
MAAPGARAPAPQAPSEEEVRELVMRTESARSQLSALESQRDLVLDLLTEARRALLTLEHVERAQDGDEVLLPLGGGAFVGARLAHGGRAISSLGSGVHAELPAADARARMVTRVESLESAASALARDIARLSDELARLNAIAEQFYGA